MAFLEVKNVAIKGISASVPSREDKISEIYQWEGINNFIITTGIESRRRSESGETAADLCFLAAQKLIQDLDWKTEDIDLLVFVSQTPDYLLPATSCVLQNRLGLSKDCYTLDISLGCSGWVYALSVISSLMQNGFMKRGLLLAGDTITKICRMDDKSTYPLFGDAGTATALEYENTSSGFKFVFNSDGSGEKTIHTQGGGFKLMTPQMPQLMLDGGEVFSFGAFKAPKQVKTLAEEYGINIDTIDIFTMHQANRMMNEMIRKKLNLPIDKVPYSLNEFGNTSSASIPLTLVTKKGEDLKKKKLNHIACGFGVGLSWATVWFETNKIKVPELIEA